MPAPTRRGFLAAGACALAAPALQARGRLAAVGVGVVGCGARGKELALEVVKQGHAVVALCDVAPFRSDAVRAALSDAMNGDAGGLLVCADYKKLLEHKAVDAVVVATPDHHHKEHLVAAVTADKDVYAETPLTKSLDEHAEVSDAVRKANRVVQVGLQRRSGAHWDEAIRAVRGRGFGRLVRAAAWDDRNWQARDPFAPPAGWKPDPKKLDWDQFLGAAAKRPFDAGRYWGWRWYWDYAGGLLTDLGTHPADLFAWAAPDGAPAAPKSAVVNGGRHVFDKWETPDIVQAVWDYGKFAAGFSAEAVNGSDGAGVRFHGTKQTLVGDETELRLYDTADRLAPGMKPVKTWKIEPETPAHVKNWLECVATREQPAAPSPSVVPSVARCPLSLIFDTPPTPSCHASTVCEVAPGVLLAAWFAGKAEGAKDVRIWSARSDGRAWSKPEVVAAEPGQPTWNPVLFKLASGEVVLWYKAGPDPQNWTGYARRSKDAGKTWSAPEQLPAGQFGPVRAKPLQLADGTLLAGTSVESYKSWAPYVDRSTDDGKTWTRSNAFAAATGPRQIQPTLVPGRDGKVVALMRSSSPRKVHRSESADGGKTFTPAEPVDLPNPSAGVDAVRTPAGDILLVFNNSMLLRTPLSLARSSDDGKTWKPVADLEATPGEFSYPAMVLSAAGTLEVTYTWNRTHIKHASLKSEG